MRAMHANRSGRYGIHFRLGNALSRPQCLTLLSSLVELSLFFRLFSLHTISGGSEAHGRACERATGAPCGYPDSCVNHGAESEGVGKHARQRSQFAKGMYASRYSGKVAARAETVLWRSRHHTTHGTRMPWSKEADGCSRRLEYR